ncbi:uncharacterized protein PV09_03337 [Verruconis gallopava]|uniref:Complex III subunit 9 n=1 Tax=Verruconis gallopava TaxID=253628 RepID=A0A0D2AEP2_9PEZI|nr:uncharacterized protein PV09_03337 [Verruconis gallopava]KIW05448.1 hypothetical protein PV09_03337 [Verruconis gallopava]
MAGLSSTIYNTFFRSNAVMLCTVFTSAFAIQIAFDAGSTKVWDSINKGRQWKDIKQRYMTQEEEE